VGVWFYGTPEQFVGHIKQALAALEHIGLFDDCQKFLKTGTSIVMPRKQLNKK
jgi:hypothetical protein